jgi:hypothetical protein
MSEDFNGILDECIDRINQGDNPEDCLSDYAAHAERLRPLLESVRDVRKTYGFVPSPDAKRAARQKFHAALEKRQQATRASLFLSIVSRPAVWATVTVLVLALVAILVVRPLLNSQTLVPSAGGNFAFLISDEPNDIGDFASLNVTISRVELQPQGSGKRLQFAPEAKTVDLTQLQGEQSQEIWRGDVPEGQYAHIVIYIDEVEGKLNSTGEIINVRLPSNKLQISMSFGITTDTVTSFTFDITVVKAGNGGKYNLKPQIGASGTRQEQKPSG